MPEELKINDTFYEDKNNFLEAASKLTCEPENIKRMSDYLCQRLDDANMAIKLNDAKALENALDAFRKSYKPMYNALERYLEIDKRRAEALEIVENMKIFNKNGNNYDIVLTNLEHDIEKYITYNNDNKQIDSFTNDLNKINEIFKKTISEEFNNPSGMSIEKILPEDYYKNSLSKYANEKVSDIIHVHNMYCINKTKKDFDNRIKNLEKLNNVNKEKLETIKRENEFFNRPVSLANAEMADGFVKIFRDINDKFTEINNELTAEKATISSQNFGNR